MKSFEKVKLVRILDDVGRLRKINVQVTVKAKALSCWIFENVPNESSSLFSEKKTKSQRENEPENPLRKEQGKEKQKEREERNEEKKKEQWLHSKLLC